MALHDLTSRFSTDALRLYYCNTGSPHVDIEFKEEDIEKYRASLDRIVHTLEKITGQGKSESHGVIDAWLAEKSTRLFADAEKALEDGALREYSELLYYQMPLDLKWYFGRGGGNRPVLEVIAENWVRTLTPITPHLAEEVWHSLLKKKSLVSTESWPAFPDRTNLTALQAEALISGLIADIEKIASVAKISSPKRITVFPAAAWKWDALQLVLRSFGERPDFKAAMAAWMANPEMKKHAPDAANFVQKVAKDPGAWRNLSKMDEAQVLESEKNWLAQRFGCAIGVDASGAGEKGAKAMPGKPAIYIE
jgi:leucyl-tRNA synthetase